MATRHVDESTKVILAREHGYETRTSAVSRLLATGSLVECELGLQSKVKPNIKNDQQRSR